VLDSRLRLLRAEEPQERIALEIEEVLLRHLARRAERLTLPELFSRAGNYRVYERKRSPHHLSELTHRLWH
jgi:hypothetical protein